MLSFYIFIFLACVSSALATGTTVKTEYGSVWSDQVLHTRHGSKFLAFRGVRYAAPPVGHLRFQAPHKPDKWHDTKNATHFGAACFQFSGLRGVLRRGVSLPYGISEDCLFVNVYTPDVQPKKLYPVLVYVHGGAFQVGTGNWFTPNNFMDSPGVVLVTVNYRLGVFGFLSSGDDALSGNWALKDQLAALKWVQGNIKHFGGDPKTVTLMGQSSGAHNVHTHTLSHASEGLFHRAIILSGTALSLWGYYPPASHEAQRTFNLLLEQTKCKKTHMEASIECLRALNPNHLKEAEQHFLANHTIPFMFRTVLEPKTVRDAFLITDPRELNYQNPKMPIIVGTCSAEGMMNAFRLLGAHLNVPEFSRILDEILPYTVHYKYWLKGDQVSSFTERLKHYFFPNPHHITLNNLMSLSTLFGKMLFQMPAVDLASTYPGKVYAYYYDHLNGASPWTNMKHEIKNSAQYNNFTGAEHGDDLISIFGPLDPRMGKLPPVDQRISDQMLVYLKHFIYTGNPNDKAVSLPKWDPVHSKKIEYLHITKEGCRAQSGWAEDPIYSFYRSLPIPWRKMPVDWPNAAHKISPHDKKISPKQRQAKSASKKKTHTPIHHHRQNSTVHKA